MNKFSIFLRNTIGLMVIGSLVWYWAIIGACELGKYLYNFFL